MTSQQPALHAAALDAPESHAETRDGRPKRSRLVYGALLGLALFFIHQSGTLSAVLQPPPGYEPAWGIRNLDLPQYLTWITAARSRLLIPDYHAPWITEPALFQPLFIAASWIPLPPLAAYYVLSALAYMGAGAALLYAVTAFCPGLEMYALLASACAVPLGMLCVAMAKMFHSPIFILWGLLGMIDYSYNSADGLFRGGQASSLTLSVGTALVLLFMGLLANFVRIVSAPRQETPAPRQETNSRRLALVLAAVSFAAALLHPFEVFVTIAASALPLRQCGRMKVWCGVTAAGLLGLAPYLAASSRALWLRDVAGSMPDVMYPFWIPENFGIVFFLLAYFLLIRFRMDDPGDRLLQSWFLATIALALIPKFTMASHLFDGFAYCVGFLLVRRLAVDRKLLPAILRHRRAVTGIVGAGVAFIAFSLFVLYQQVWKDGRRADPEWLLSAVRPVSERPLLEWLRTHATTDELVLSPPDLAPWIATVPLTSFASHDVFGITFADQLKLASAFFSGEDVNGPLIESYGVRLAVVPSTSPAITRLPASSYRASIGSWRIYEFPDARMKPYPGLSHLKPELAPPLRVRILEWLEHLH